MHFGIQTSCKRRFLTDTTLGPGSFLEVTKILPLLTEPRQGQAFHVVAPSLPNFGFSQQVRQRGFAVKQYAECMHKVMLRLGYDTYGTNSSSVEYEEAGTLLTTSQWRKVATGDSSSLVSSACTTPSTVWHHISISHALGPLRGNLCGLAFSTFSSNTPRWKNKDLPEHYGTSPKAQVT